MDVDNVAAMEHLLPEQMCSTKENSAHGISAVKALQLAAAEGQKIWTITRANLNQALAGLDLSLDEESDIRNAVLAGKEVTAHERPVNFHGRAAVGYTVLDPNTGAGAYLISSGESGGVLDSWFDEALSWLATAGELFASSCLAKIIFGGLGKVLDALGFVFDVYSCGLFFALIKQIFVSFMVFGVAYAVLPFFAIFVTLAMVMSISLMIGVVVSSVLSRRMGCGEDG